MTRSKSERKNEAYDRNKFWETLTPQEQLQSLDSRLGKDIGAIQQRNKIQSLIDRPKSTKDKKSTKGVKNVKKNKGLR